MQNQRTCVECGAAVSKGSTRCRTCSARRVGRAQKVDRGVPRVCSQCGELKEPQKFGARLAECKVCNAKRSQQWRATNPDKQRVQSKDKYERLKVERPDYHRTRAAAWRAANRERANLLSRANLAVGRALKRGELERPDTCERCDAAGVIEAHHEDYARPFVVVWLCRLCHAEADRQRRAQEVV